MKQTKKLSNKFLITMACGLMSALLVGCAGIGPVYIPGNADTYDLDVTIDTRGTTISMWTGFGSQINTVMEELLDEFEQRPALKLITKARWLSNLLKAINLASTSGSFPNS